MEVDLLSAESQIAIELDGGQHLAVAEAYRRDRRKDVLLQAAPGLQGAPGENGIMCCGFCAKMLASAFMRFWMHRPCVVASMYESNNGEREELGWDNSTESQPMLPG
jgi:hypothetical protein